MCADIHVRPDQDRTPFVRPDLVSLGQFTVQICNDVIVVEAWNLLVRYQDASDPTSVAGRHRTRNTLGELEIGLGSGTRNQ